MTIKVFSKENCGKCESAKEKIVKLGFTYNEHSLEYHMELHDGWREDNTTDLMAYLTSKGKPKEQLPTIEIDGKYYDYPGATKKLKRKNKEE